MTGKLPKSLQAALCSLSIVHVDGTKIQKPRTEARVCVKIRDGWKELPELPHSIKAESSPKARSTMRALLTLATLKPTEDCLTDTVVLALMNWMSKGDRATAPFSQELSKSECDPRDITVRATREHFG